MGSIHQLSHDDAIRLIGHRAGMVTALLEVRRQIADIRYHFERVPAWHVRRLRVRAVMLQPLLDLEEILKRRIEEDGASIAGQGVLKSARPTPSPSGTEGG